MSTYKHTPTTDALDTLGTIITPNEKRDAIHLGVEPVVAGQLLKPGQHIKLEDGYAFPVPAGKGIGIVDPFLLQDVQGGEMFWLVVYPRQITSLRHVWEHPAFPASGETQAIAVEVNSESKRFVEDLASELEVTYDDLMENARYFQEHGDYWNEGEKFDGRYVPEEFWDHYEILTGKKAKDRYSFLSCSC